MLTILKKNYDEYQVFEDLVIIIETSFRRDI